MSTVLSGAMPTFVQFAHDRFARKVFRRPPHAAVLLRAALPPELFNRLDLATLRYRSPSLIDDRLREQFTDLLFSVDCGDRPLMLLFLIEHKSHFDRWTPLQVLGYKLQIWRELRESVGNEVLLPDVVPIVLYHGERPAPNPWCLRSLFLDPDGPVGGYRVDDESYVFDLGSWSDPALRDLASDVPIAALALVVMKAIRGPEIPLKLRDCGDQIRAVLEAARGATWLQIVVRYILAGAPHVSDARELQRTMREIAGTKAEEIVMTAGEKLYAQGIEKGIQAGIEKGIQTGIQTGIEKGSADTLRENIVRVLRARFGAVPARLDVAIHEETNRERLDRLLELALRVGDLAEFQNASSEADKD